MLRRSTGCACLLATVLLTMLIGASAASAKAHWRLSALPAPTNLPPTGEGYVAINAVESGNAEVSANSTNLTITDTLPVGMTIKSIHHHVSGQVGEQSAAWSCSGTGTNVVNCKYNALAVPAVERYTVAPNGYLELALRTEDEIAPGTYPNTTTVEGGREAIEADHKVVVEGGSIPETEEVPAQEEKNTFTVSSTPTPFGVEERGYSIALENENGEPETRAGVHPFQLTTTFNLNEGFEQVGEATQRVPTSPGLPENLHFNLPPGLLGNVTKVPTCSGVQFGSTHSSFNACPENTAIGAADVQVDEPRTGALIKVVVPVFNLEPQRGEPARFGFIAVRAPVYLDTRVRSGDGSGTPGGGDYGVEVSVHEATQLVDVLATAVTLWGYPGDTRHDGSRGWACLNHGGEVEHSLPCGPTKERAGAFLVSPTSCASPLLTTVDGESWPVKKPGEPGLGGSSPLAASFQFPLGLEDCGALPFEPSISLKANQTSSSTPTGLEVDVHVPQQSTLEPEGRAESAVKSTTVTLPEGVQLSPSAADGLQACSEQEIGYQGEGKIDPFSPSLGEPPHSAGEGEPLRFSPTVTAPDGSQVLTNCPDASKVGTVSVKTPLLKNELHGSVYLAAQNANPFGSLVALYIAVEDPESGVVAKLAGDVKLNAATGQITSTFLNTPQVPFEDFIVDFNDGPRASVSTPPSCGSYTTTAGFVPWSTGIEQATSSAPFDITSGPGGGACPNPQPFGPGFAASASNTQAGAFTPFSVTIERPDSNQALKTVSVTLPPGAAAMLSSATQCPEPQASNGTCGPESLIGHATASSGYGPDPFTVTGGLVYITGPYHGAPFGLSIVTPANAGPFHLGNVIVRSSINVNPSTAAVTITSTLPTMVSTAENPDTGIPLQLKRINVVVDRPNFEFNPTNCTPMSVTGTLGGAGGSTASVSSPFKVENCAALPFHPTLTASTQGNASKANGASLTVKVASTPGQANIAKTRLVLPVALPSRLTTIQKACLAKVFEANPAGCPEGSNIGTATVHTPVLKSPLTGPAYLVSHGNAAFPDVEFVLQGEGITLILDGLTDIKKGITTSTFNAVPDAPVTTFETTLPEGPHSALTSNVAESKHFSLCGTKLVIPTTITGQNGVVIQQETKVPVAGCKGVLGKKETKTQKLKRALKACRKKFKHNKKKRASCEKQARKKYGTKTKAKSKKTKKSAKH
jgi:hypothetical protein